MNCGSVHVVPFSSALPLSQALCVARGPRDADTRPRSRVAAAAEQDRKRYEKRRAVWASPLQRCVCVCAAITCEELDRTRATCTAAEAERVRLAGALVRVPLPSSLPLRPIHPLRLFVYERVPICTTLLQEHLQGQHKSISAQAVQQAEEVRVSCSSFPAMCPCLVWRVGGVLGRRSALELPLNAALHCF